MAKIFIVEDDADFSKVLVSWLTNEHHTVEAVYDGLEAKEHLKTYEYDLIILDWDLPGMAGVDICKEFRAKGRNTPILMLTGRGAVVEKEQGLDAGADDYLTKPFNMRELSARVRAILRRSAGATSNDLRAGSIVLDSTKYRVTKDGKEIRLLPKEFALLEFLMRHPNQVFSADALLDRVWRSAADSSTDTVRQCITRIRQKLGSSGDSVAVTTIHGVGYMMDVP